MDMTTFAIRADQLLTMPDEVDALDEYDPDGDLDERDREITGAIADGGVFVDEGRIQWIGEWNERPEAARGSDVAEIEAGLVTPGWVDCHTHAVFAGERSNEFMLRNAGRSYIEIQEAGGGIRQTVESVRSASQEELAKHLFDRVFESVRRGVTTLEVKSGYGLSVEDELKSLRAIRRVQEEDVPCELIPCFMGGHVVPSEYEDDRKAYVDLLCNEMIPRVGEEGLADYCDVFCDRGAFTVSEAERILLTGKNHGLTPRIHADQMSDSGGVTVATQVGASSADHLEHTSIDELRAMAEHDVTAVLLPSVNLFLDQLDALAPAREALEAGCEVALATDFNPGTSMTQDLGLVMHLGCTLYGLTPGEALRAVTLGAADALDRDDLGRLRVGEEANLALFDAPHLRYLPYHVGQSHVAGVIQDGQIAYWVD